MQTLSIYAHILAEYKTQYVQYRFSTPTGLVVQMTNRYGRLDISWGFRVILQKLHIFLIYTNSYTYRYYSRQLLMIRFQIGSKIRGNVLFLKEILILNK